MPPADVEGLARNTAIACRTQFDVAGTQRLHAATASPITAAMTTIHTEFDDNQGIRNFMMDRPLPRTVFKTEIGEGEAPAEPLFILISAQQELRPPSFLKPFAEGLVRYS